MKNRIFSAVGLCVGCEYGNAGNRNHLRQGGKLASADFLLPKIKVSSRGKKLLQYILEATQSPGQALRAEIIEMPVRTVTSPQNSTAITHKKNVRYMTTELPKSLL
ncbi:hypothetical protein [Thalassospira indica]|uniref:hypothetical protein n=1 Tax=Thalassospira indica TaxID=1891279 RepID=UPI0013EDAC04|nr:hypothetical protein [Thalassospira indica]